ncbi:MAG: helix-turn-helix transcriptional regulator [Bosea sp.]|uniref:helix-turn-helix domain-containing protein n=1 Tax=Bosea sp. (in: a-proteobacteria) TaxID=1871050 RepID=UPI001AC461C1|nr:helix-turn-helix transcriptional regulator [Bosea sp. (in: a-proteobacteria)]MBN9472293.1 helix-turn-helix transcriptional regulator [Bosea sp. (in: a-proteobacteria)]
MQTIERIRRDIFGLKQSEFAEIAGTSQGTVSRWESGESCPGLDQLQQIRTAAVERGLPWDDALFFDASLPAPKSEAA